MKQVKRLIGLVFKESSGRLWERGAIFETFNENDQFVFLCGECSIKEIRGWRPTDSELEKMQADRKVDVIEPPSIPDKFRDSLFVGELDWTYRLREDGMIICDRCGKTVI